MDTELAVRMMSALAHETRLSVVRQLIKKGEMNAGDLSKDLNVSPSTLSAHLKDLKTAEIICNTKKGRFVYYHANIRAIGDLVGYLFLECCNGQPEVCSPQLGIINALSSAKEL